MKKKRVSITTHRVYTETVTQPEEAVSSLTEADGQHAFPQRDKNKLVGRVAATDLNGYLTTSVHSLFLPTKALYTIVLINTIIACFNLF